ncbi:MAG: hypothetical protein Q8N10_03490 [Phenylobacterium sp.]|uniref:hypothetical protein n=1 Tax=Phenylobacterium sp. TaxID=1871053 RepID=UPI00271A7BC7|nr:hypothetical protein [Phenylobacterium sp.]MDO8912334.1 hypothetical protein [Phenylobacterium sp.]MDP3099546.1 hypothetical protein [Phenylobacterium sp.]
MNAPVTIIEETAISFVADPQTPLAVLQNKAEADSLFARVQAEIEAHVPDLTTAKGREAIKSLAFKVTKTKTAVDAARKTLTEDARKQVDAANAAGRVIWDRLEALAIEARRPLTEWEEAEKARVETVANCFGAIEDLSRQVVEDTAAAVAERAAQLQAMTFDAKVFGDSLERAESARAAGIEGLNVLHARLTQEEADRAELARLRQEAAEREERERAEVAAKEAAQAEATRAAQAKADEDARAEREADARSLAAANAAEDARKEAERASQAALAEQARAHQAELDRIQRETDAEAAKAKREADEAEAREKNRAHVSKIMGAAKLAVMGLGVSEDHAKAVVKAIQTGAIPHVSIKF